MRVFQTTYRDRNGRTRTAARWYIEFSDHREIRRRIPGLTDKKATESLGRQIERLARFRAGGEALDPVMTKWVENLSTKLRDNLAKIGLLDGKKLACLRPLAEHLDGAPENSGYRQHLTAKGNTPGHVEKTCARARRLLDGCGFVFWSDISASRLTAFLHDLQDDTADENGNTTRGISAQTRNYYLGAFKSFCRWMVKDGRASESPVAHLDALNARTDRRLVRRALDVDEIRWLLDAARNGPDRYGMTGPERAMLYRVALETGLRRGELASLTRSSFALDGERPVVSVAAAYSKHRREDALPLRPDTAVELRDILAVKLPGAAAFNLPKDRHDSSAMFQADLAAARTAWIQDAASQGRKDREGTSFLSAVDASGRTVDFHALRHTCGSLLAASGAHPKVAQSIMRHSDINLTLSRYSHVYAGQEASAVAALPDLDAAPVKQSAKATGTNDMKVTVDVRQDFPGRAPKPSTARQIDELAPTTRPADRPNGVLRSARLKTRVINDTRNTREPDRAANDQTGDSVLSLCLAQTGSFSCASVRDDAHKDEAARHEDNPCKQRENRVSMGRNVSTRRSGGMADAHGLGPCE